MSFKQLVFKCTLALFFIVVLSSCEKEENFLPLKKHTLTNLSKKKQDCKKFYILVTKNITSNEAIDLSKKLLNEIEFKTNKPNSFLFNNTTNSFEIENWGKSEQNLIRENNLLFQDSHFITIGENIEGQIHLYRASSPDRAISFIIVTTPPR